MREYECVHIIGYRHPLFVISLCRDSHPIFFVFYDAIGIVPRVGKVGTVAPFYSWRN